MSKRQEVQGENAFSKLPIRHQAFVNEYFLCNFNGTEAAKKAGFAGDSRTLAVTASRLLRNDKVRAHIEKRLKEHTMSANEVLSRLTEQARASVADLIRVSHDGTPVIDFSNERLHAVKSIRVKPTKYGDEVEFELHDAQRALELIGKSYALFTDKVRVDDWRSQAVEDIKAGKIDYEALADAFDESLATELFRAAGVPIQAG